MLKSVQPVFFDEIWATMTKDNEKVEAILKRFSVNVVKLDKPWDDNYSNWNFGAARNAALEKCTTDWVMFLDTDDTLPNAVGVRKLISSHRQHTCINVPYFYEENNVHTRERIFRNGLYGWWGMVNECIIPITPIHKVYEAEYHELYTKHHKDDSVPRADRNTAIIEREYLEAKTPRTVYYCGRNNMFSGNFQRAKKFFEEFLEMPNGSPEEKYCALMAMYKMTQDVDEMRQYAQQALDLNPNHAEAYFKMAFVNLMEDNYVACIHNSLEGFRRPSPLGQPRNELEFTLMPARILDAALQALKNVKECKVIVEKYHKLFPDDEYFKNRIIQLK
jgi:tetratricopeptide (TPR) repeat protein